MKLIPRKTLQNPHILLCNCRITQYCRPSPILFHLDFRCVTFVRYILLIFRHIQNRVCFTCYLDHRPRTHKRSFKGWSSVSWSLVDHDEPAILNYLWCGFETDWLIHIQSTSVGGLSNADCNSLPRMHISCGHPHSEFQPISTTNGLWTFPICT